MMSAIGDNDRITISYDPSTGKLEFAAPKDRLDEASNAAQILIKTAHACLLPKDGARRPEQAKNGADLDAPPPPSSTARSGRRSGSSGSSGRPGRIGSFEKIELGLSEDQERAIHGFYSTRRPAEQRHQVVVAMYIGEKILKRALFDYNEIYTLMHLGGERELPKALDVVLAQLQKDNWVNKDARSYGLKFLARDFVDKIKVIDE